MHQKKGCRSSKKAETAGTSAKSGMPAIARMPATETAAARIPRKSAEARTPVSVSKDICNGRSANKFVFFK